MNCRNCGYEICTEAQATKAVQEEYKYSSKELSITHIINVWCPDCAVTDGRIGNLDETRPDFHWEVSKI